jgi:Tfp pilus assembly protein PilW
VNGDPLYVENKRENMKPDTIIDIVLLIAGIVSLIVLMGIIFIFS